MPRECFIGRVENCQEFQRSDTKEAVARHKYMGTRDGYGRRYWMTALPREGLGCLPLPAMLLCKENEMYTLKLVGLSNNAHTTIQSPNNSTQTSFPVLLTLSRLFFFYAD